MIKLIIVFLFMLSPYLLTAQWVQTTGPTGGNIDCFATIGNSIFACNASGSGIFRSTNEGVIWSPINNGLISLSVHSLATVGNNLFAGTWDYGVFLSTNEGVSWSAVNNGLTFPTVISFAVANNNIYAGTAGGGVFFSSNNGSNWSAINTGLTNLYVEAIEISGNNIFAGTQNGGIFRSTNNGTSWNSNGLTNLSVTNIAISGINIFAGTWGGGVFLSSNSGASWNSVNTGISNLNISSNSLKFSNQNIIVGTYGNGIFRSTNNGASWSPIGLSNTIVTSIAVFDNNLFAGTAFSGGNYRSTNNGMSWSIINNGLTNVLVNCLAISDNNMFAGTWERGLFLSADNGASWSSQGLTSFGIQCLLVNGSNIHVGTAYGGVKFSTNYGATWSSINSGLTNLNVLAIARSDNNIYAGTQGGGMFRSTNGGSSWVSVNSGLTNLNISCIKISDNKIFAGTYSGLFLSTNNGTTWVAINNGLSNLNVRAITISGNNTFVGTAFNGGVFISTNNGSSWTAINNGLTDLFITDLFVAGDYILAGTRNAGIFKSSNNGQVWHNESAGLWNNQMLISSLAIKNDTLYAGTHASVWKKRFVSNTGVLNLPIPYSKLISGETSAITWSGLIWQNLNIKCLLNFGTLQQDTVLLAFQYPGTFNQFPWNIPDTILSYRSKIVIENASNPTQKIESDIFRIKPYLLTRVNPDSTYHEYRKNRDQWGFWNDSIQMWPHTWYQQFDYLGIDPFTGSQYSQWQGYSVFLYSQPINFPDWVSWVSTFTIDSCYENLSQARYSLRALDKWRHSKKGWFGSCFGIATSNSIVFRNKPEFFVKYPNFTSYNNPIDVNSSNIVRKTITELCAHQFGQPHTNYRRDAKLNKLPNETLEEIRNMLLSENEPIKILGFENNDLGGGAHVVNVIKVEKDKTNPKVFNVYIYDNREPDSSSIIKINTLENNGNGTWFYSSLPDWGGDSLFYLIDPSISYLSNPSFDNINNNKKTIALYDTLIQIFNQESQDILIYDNLGNNSGFVNDTLFRNIPNSTADIIPSGIKLAPYSYTLTPGEYSILLKGFKSETIQLGLFTGNKSFSYERYNATSSQTDKLNFDDGVSVSNPDPEVKTISLLNIQDETTHDKLFAFSSLEMAQNDSVKIENLGSDNFKLISYGSTKNYDIELNYVSQLELGRFINANIDLPSNSSHIFVPEWNNVTNSQLVILEDLGNNGTIDDTLRVNNIITNTEEEFVPLPDKYFLAQNYPNPFNPSTLIKYEIKNDAMVTLKVYNILGKEVASLVNEIKRAGRYEIEFNGSNLSSGIYYYRLDAGEFSETRKMLLIK